MTRLCVSIFVHHIEQALRDIAHAAEAGAEMIELRIDITRDASAVSRLIKACSLPVIITCRAAYEGGQCDLPDGDRLDLLCQIAAQHEVIVDFELAALQRNPSLKLKLPRRSIVSSHDFNGRPARLSNLLLEMSDGMGEIAKLAWQTRTIRDNIEAFEILLQKQKPTIAICMGETGSISRILAKKFGSFVTFASLNADAATAPGQVSVQEMKQLYRWDKLDPDTRVFGVVAHPVKHSMSPAIHNASFDATGYNGIYLPLLVNPGYESFKAFMESFLGFAPLHLGGLSITIPHKENALRYLTETGAAVDELAVRIGAVNTIAIDWSGGVPKLRGFNTDYAAILDSICAKLDCRRDDLRNYRVAVLGAGGTGRAAVAGLSHVGATVVVYNRTRERAESLANEFNGKTGKVVAANMEKLCDSCCDIYVNTTSVGMSPNVDESPFGDKPPALSSSHVVFDAIYNPIETRLLKQASQAGARTINGVDMFVRQAAGQFEAWTHLPPPVAVMRRIVEARLNGQA